MAAVSFSKLKVGSTYVLPAPSDVDRFTMGRNDKNLKDTRYRFLMRQGYPMTVTERGANGTLGVSIADVPEDISEDFFPVKQGFKPFVVGVDKIPPPLPPPAPDPSDPWDEFYPKNFNYDRNTDDEYVKMTPEYKLMLLRPDGMQNSYGRPGYRPKIADVFSSDDLAAQRAFTQSLVDSGGKEDLIDDYLFNSRRYTTPQAAWSLFPSGPEPPPDTDPLTDDEKEDYKNILFGAPKLTREIEVFRGVRNPETDIESLKRGTLPISTSYDKYTARDYTFAGKGECCILRIIVKPGVRCIALDLYRFPKEPEKIGEWGNTSACEILICPPYNVQVEDIGAPTSGLKRVTITPKPSGGRRRTRKTKRRARKTRRRSTKQ
jgi:hypothetical protein